jgi:hypothetical protein
MLSVTPEVVFGIAVYTNRPVIVEQYDAGSTPTGRQGKGDDLRAGALRLHLPSYGEASVRSVCGKGRREEGRTRGDLMIDGGTNRTAERLMKATWGSYRSVVDGLVAVQEQNMRLAQDSVEVFLGQAEKQREALQAMLEESFKIYAGLLYVPVTSRNGLRADGSGDADLPIEDYDRLNVKEVIGRLEELSAEEVEELKEYEKRNKNRVSLIERFDRSLV